MGVYEENIVPIKISRLAEYMAEKKHLSLEDVKCTLDRKLVDGRL
jgi:hypothetical protein